MPIEYKQKGAGSRVSCYESRVIYQRNLTDQNCIVSNVLIYI